MFLLFESTLDFSSVSGLFALGTLDFCQVLTNIL